MTSKISHDERTPTRIRAVSRASRLLLLVARRPEGVGATEAAAALGLAVPTAHHLLSTLCQDGLLARDARRRFVLGAQVAVLADGFLREGAMPDFLRAPLVQLAEETQQTVYLTAWRRGEIHALHSIEGVDAVRVANVERGLYRCPHARATGKLLLAFAEPALRARMLGDGPLEAVTPRTIVDRAALELELAEIRERGWAEDREEFRPGVACVSAPALVGGVVLAAYTVACPAERYAPRRRQLRDAVRRAAAAAASHPDAVETT